jgi:hypothetical protein
LLAIGEAEERFALLFDRRDEIITHCLGLLDGATSEPVKQCQAALVAFQQDHFEVSQSHSAGLIESTIGRIFTKHEKKKMLKEIREIDFESVRFNLAGDRLVHSPIEVALRPYFPNSGGPVPKHFSRNATAHSVGVEGVFSPSKSLIAAMLATSLIYSRERAE